MQHVYTDVILAEYEANVFTLSELQEMAADDEDPEIAASAQEVLDMLKEKEQ